MVPISTASGTLLWFVFLTLSMNHSWISITLVSIPTRSPQLPPSSVLLKGVPPIWPLLGPLLSVVPCQTFPTLAVPGHICFASIIAWFLPVSFSGASIVPSWAALPLVLFSARAYPRVPSHYLDCSGIYSLFPVLDAKMGGICLSLVRLVDR